MLGPGSSGSPLSNLSNLAKAPVGFESCPVKTIKLCIKKIMSKELDLARLSQSLIFSNSYNH